MHFIGGENVPPRSCGTFLATAIMARQVSVGSSLIGQGVWYMAECFCIISSYIVSWYFWQPFVKRFALCYLTVVCLSCLSVTLVYCDQTVGWIKMKLGMQVSRPRPWPHGVRWGPTSPSPRGAQPPNFRPISVVAKWLDGLRCHLIWR